MAKRRRRLGRADKGVASELELFAQNDYTTYSRCIRPLEESGIKFAKKGKFNPAKFCKAVRKRCVALTEKEYKRQIGGMRVGTEERNVFGASLCKSMISTVSSEVGKNVLKLPRS